MSVSDRLSTADIVKPERAGILTDIWTTEVASTCSVEAAGPIVFIDVLLYPESVMYSSVSLETAATMVILHSALSSPLHY